MKNKLVWLGLSFLMVATMLFVSCAKSTTTSTATSSTTASIKTTTSTTNKTTNTITPTTTATSTTVTGNWWDSLGKPQYGGEMNLQLSSDLSGWDPINSAGSTNIHAAYIEKTIGDNWTVNPSVFAYQTNWRPDAYVTGNLAESYEMTDPSTFVMHLRQGVYWQNIPPVNGREFTADDIVFHYDRSMGVGGGYTTIAPSFAGQVWVNLISVTATDQWTVVFKWKIKNPEAIMEQQEAISDANSIECPEAVKQWGNLADWHHAVGTGPFILTDYVSGSSATLVKNTNYWAHDERYPQNQLPYVDTVNFLIIPDNATCLAAMRTGKLDVLNQQSPQNAQSMQKTNPGILQIPTPSTVAVSLSIRCDLKPFTDIRVRQALQMAIDLQSIAKDYYAGTADPSPCSLTSNYLTGWCFPYSQWPQDLKDEYAYNPTQAKALLAAAGYPNGFNTDLVACTTSDSNLLQIVKAYYAAINVNMSIQTMDSATWLNFVRYGKKEDALAERTGSDSLGLTYEPSMQINRFTQEGSANLSNVNDPKVESWYAQAQAATTVDEWKQIFVDENKYIAQQHFAIFLSSPLQFAFCQPWLKGYSGQTMSITGEVGAPQVCYFYASRFWIDQKLKTSMGH